MGKSGKEYVNLRELSQLIGVSYDGLRHKILDGQVPGARKLGRRWFIRLDEFDQATREAAEK